MPDTNRQTPVDEEWKGPWRTYAKSKHIRKSARGVVEDMELASLEYYKPTSDTIAKSLPDACCIDDQGEGVEGAEDASNDHLSI